MPSSGYMSATLTHILLASETSQHGGVWSHPGRPGEADCCSQHSAQRDWGLQLAAVCQLCWWQGEHKRTFSLQMSGSIQEVSSCFQHLLLSFPRTNILLWRNSTTTWWWVELVACDTFFFLFQVKDMSWNLCHLEFILCNQEIPGHREVS